MQATVYENPNTAAAAGVAYPGAHVVHGGMNFRQNNSPPGVQLPSSHAASRGSATSMVAATSSQSTHGDTPALTPHQARCLTHLDIRRSLQHLVIARPHFRTVEPRCIPPCARLALTPQWQDIQYPVPLQHLS
jgi:hypothetical protein